MIAGEIVRQWHGSIKLMKQKNKRNSTDHDLKIHLKGENILYYVMARNSFINISQVFHKIFRRKE